MEGGIEFSYRDIGGESGIQLAPMITRCTNYGPWDQKLNSEKLAIFKYSVLMEFLWYNHHSHSEVCGENSRHNNIDAAESTSGR